mmetsp:Transcript_20904/g.41824  ORF Transcript_20904/g.41824 Transcript_20904/m.41824 type:complete len:190 (+) Transcript_20904:650-1219(+)
MYLSGMEGLEDDPPRRTICPLILPPVPAGGRLGLSSIVDQKQALMDLTKGNKAGHLPAVYHLAIARTYGPAASPKTGPATLTSSSRWISSNHIFCPLRRCCELDRHSSLRVLRYALHDPQPAAPLPTVPPLRLRELQRIHACAGGEEARMCNRCTRVMHLDQSTACQRLAMVAGKFHPACKTLGVGKNG